MLLTFLSFPEIEPTGKYSFVISPVILGAPTCLLLKKLTLFVRQITRRLAWKNWSQLPQRQMSFLFPLKKASQFNPSTGQRRSLYFFVKKNQVQDAGKGKGNN